MEINDVEWLDAAGPCPPGTVIALDKMEGRLIRVLTQEEAVMVAEAAEWIAENWDAQGGQV